MFKAEKLPQLSSFEGSREDGTPICEQTIKGIVKLFGKYI